jgi:hypothetical protein
VSPKPLTAGDLAAFFPELRVIGIAPGTEVPTNNLGRTATVKLGQTRRSDVSQLMLQGGLDTLIVEYSSVDKYKTAMALGL